MHLVDDQEVSRNVVGNLVAATDGFILVGEARTAEDALEAMDDLSLDVVVIDVRMRGMGGVEGAVTLLDRYPDRARISSVWGDAPFGRPSTIRNCGPRLKEGTRCKQTNSTAIRSDPIFLAAASDAEASDRR